MSAIVRERRTTARAVTPAAVRRAEPAGASAVAPLAVRVAFVALPVLAWVGLVAGSHVYAPKLVDLVVYAGLATAAWRLARPAGVLAPAGVRTASVEIALAAALGAACAAAGYRGVLLGTGVPAFRHDWAWPADPEAMRGLFTYLTSDWTLRAFGEPKLYPSVAPIFAVLSPLGAFVAPGVLLAGLLAACVAAGAAGAYAAARRWLGVAPLAGAVASLAYACAPYVVDKAVAGHVHVLVAYAVFPWLVVVLDAVDRERSLRRTAAWVALESALIGVSLAAITFFAFDALALALVAAVSRRRARAFVALAVSLAGGALCHVQSIAHVERAWRAGTDLGPVGIAWLEQLSGSAATLLSQFAYAPQYAAGGLPALLRPNAAFVLVPVALAAFGFAVASRRGPLVAVGALGFAGTVVATGLDGPFAGLKHALFAHAPALAAFREFYNAQLLVAFAFALAAAALVDGARASRGRALSAAAATIAVAVSVTPFLSGTVAHDLLLWREPVSYGALAQRLSPSDGARIAMMPLVQPIRAGDEPFAGTDTFFSGFRGHPTLAEWSPEPAVALAALTFARGDIAGGRRLLGALGVRYVVDRKMLSSALPANWYADLFPRGWETGRSDAAVASAPGWTRLDDDATLTLLEDRAALPLVSLAPEPAPCGGSPLLSLRAGRCDAAAHGGSAWRDVALEPDPVAIDPHAAWTVPHALFAQGYALAAASRGVATVGATPYALRFDARPGERLFLRCASRDGLRVYVDGALAGDALCRSSVDAATRWTGPFETHPGRNRVVVQSGAGPSLVEDAALASGALPPADAFAWTRPFDAPFQRAHVTERRTSATELVGTYDAPRPLWLVFSDAFDPGWTLAVDGAATAAPARVDGVENGFAVPAGAHRFRIAYRTTPLDRLLGATQTAAWFAFAFVPLLSLGLASARRGG